MKAWLPYVVPGKSRRVTVDVDDLRRLTVLVGPNASGKTSVLESVGYLLAACQDAWGQAIATSLASTLRPSRLVPGLVAVSGLLGDTVLSSLYVRPSIADPEVLEDTGWVLGRVVGVDHEVIEALANDAKTLETFITSIQKEKNLGSRSQIMDVGEKFFELASEVLGEKLSVARAPKIPGIRVSELVSKPTIHADIFTALHDWYPIYVVYTLASGELLSKSIVLDLFDDLLVIKRESKRVAPGIVVFHPWFAFWHGGFESLHYDLVGSRGLPNEEKAIELLREYIPWFGGFDLVYDTLFVKTPGGGRLPVYSLSDGQRVAVFLGMLYAAERRGSVFLVDMPEAYVHPDGLPIMGKLLAQLVAEGEQVLVTTQSLSLVKTLLKAAKSQEILEDTVVAELGIDEKGCVRPFAEWSGAASERSIADLSADLKS